MSSTTLHHKDKYNPTILKENVLGTVVSSTMLHHRETEESCLVLWKERANRQAQRTARAVKLPWRYSLGYDIICRSKPTM